MHRALLAAALSLLASPALADAYVYSGTLGKLDIVAEFTSDPAAGGEIAGRYFYTSKGIDIPLDPAKAANGKLAFAEEAPCTEDTCTWDYNDNVVKGVDFGAKWELSPARNGKGLTGKWTAKGRNLPVELSLVGTRELPEGAEVTPAALYDITDQMTYGEQPITREVSPYDFLRMQVKLVESDPVTIEGSVYRFVTDPRTSFQYPRIVSLADGSDPALANAWLENRHWMMSEDALSCESRQYGAFGWNESVAYAAGTLGGYVDEGVDINGLTPTIFSFTEAGSLDCGNAHPYNHSDIYNLDLKTGQPLRLEKILAGWVPHDLDGADVDPAFAAANPDEVRWGPDNTLVELIMSHLGDSESNFDVDSEDCGYADLVRHNLDASFKPGDRIQFAFGDLEYVIQACGGDLWDPPLADIDGLLAPTAKDYFPALAAK